MIYLHSSYISNQKIVVFIFFQRGTPRCQIQTDFLPNSEISHMNHSQFYTIYNYFCDSISKKSETRKM